MQGGYITFNHVQPEVLRTEPLHQRVAIHGVYSE